MTTPFVHLRLHTEYSLLDSVVRVPELVAAVGAAGMPAVAISDQGNLFAMVKFYREALQNGIKPIVGVDLLVRESGERAQPSRLAVLCQSDEGYRNITRLVTRSYLEGQQRGPAMIDRAWLTPDNVRGLIALSCAGDGDVGRFLVSGRIDDADRALERWLELFEGRYYIELQRLGRPDDETHVAAAVTLASRRDVAVVATNDVRFLTRDDYESHEARVCIHDGALLADASRKRRYTRDQYLRTPADMALLFADLPEALANSVAIARRCSLTLKLGEMRLPEFPAPDGLTAVQFIKNESNRGLSERFGPTPIPDSYTQRLERELQVVCQMGFAGYFLIVADFIRWARTHEVPVGPGRGSGAGSLVAYALGITDLDPLLHDLLFERFLNPERVSMPDFDVDFCMDGRDRVIEYVSDKYGRDKVSQIITYGTLAAKAAVRDVGRVLGMSYGFVDRIAKLIPFELHITLDDALVKEPELKRLYDGEEDVRNLIDLARSLEGLTRNAGTHAGGVVIAPSVLTDFAPLYCEEGSNIVVTQFDKDDVEAAGLVKFDFLGLRTLTIISRAVAIINGLRAPRAEALLDIATLPTEDPATFALLKACSTTAVFQLESRGMKDLIRRLQPDRFEDIVALVALFRPGPLQSGMVDDFINRKHGRSDGPIDYLHPALQPVLAPTYGVILYQEQVMQIAQVLAGYTLGGADLLRRAMGKKKAEEMAKQRSVFVSGAVERGVAQSLAAHIFDLMEKFAGYGFNKSHSAAYALLSYQTAYLKAHEPAAFMAAVLSADMDHTDKVVTLIEECKQIRVAIEPPDVNESRYEFAVGGPRTIRYGLGAIKGVGRNAVEALVAEREARGQYRSLEDLCRRLDLQRVGRRVLDALIRSGSLDCFGVSRARLAAQLPESIQLGEQNLRAHEAGQVDFFGLAAPPEDGAAPQVRAPLAAVVEWSEAAQLAGERETLGLYLSGHPIDRFEADLPRFTSARIADLVSERPGVSVEGPRAWIGRPATVAGLIHEIRKRGTRISFVLDDRSGRIEVSIFDEIYQRFRDVIAKDALVIVEGQVRFDEFIDSWRLSAKKISELHKAREQHAKRLWLQWPSRGDTNAAALGRLADVLTPWRGGPCQIAIRYAGQCARGALTLAPEWNVKPARELLDQLESLVGRGGVRVDYDPPT